MESNKRERKCNKEKVTKEIATKRICVPIEKEDYDNLIHNAEKYRAFIDEISTKHPVLFPSTIKTGYKLHDILPESTKMKGVRLRRIQLKSNKEVYSIAANFIMPYMTGFSYDVEKPLFLRRFNVPYWGLSYVLVSSGKPYRKQ